ncbi:MAG: mono/diheme cytochrome c family protein [Chlamydiales bacterium]|jgi:mono/diheme cytochrome c family protein
MRFDRADIYQIILISLSVVSALLFGVFVYYEMFPEYKIYQNTYVDLEEFRSTHTGERAPDFKLGIKQIVIPKEDKGPETIDRCTTCHVALKLSHFSPTKIAYDINGNMIIGENGRPVQIENEEYVWKLLDTKVASLTDKKLIEQLRENGEEEEIQRRLDEAERLSHLKSIEEHGHSLDMTKALAMHPLIGREERPFEYHSSDEIGCVVCHNGNGRSITSGRAHGPVYDGTYEESSEGHKIVFTENDEENDPAMARVFNGRPGHHLLFQTTPLYVSGLMQAKCAQCHQSGGEELQQAYTTVEAVTTRKEKQAEAIGQGVANDQKALFALLEIKDSLENIGSRRTLEMMSEELQDISLGEGEQRALAFRISLLSGVQDYLQKTDKYVDDEAVLNAINGEISKILGSEIYLRKLEAEARALASSPTETLLGFLSRHVSNGKGISGSIFAKMAAMEEAGEVIQLMDRVKAPLETAILDQELVHGLRSDAEDAMGSYFRGQQLYMSTACYACHKIGGLSRGQVGPDLSEIGQMYPWYVKEAIVWPQSNLKTSTMPNFKLDHEEVEDLLAFLMAQRKEDKTTSEVLTQVSLKEWAGGKKRAWEKPLPVSEWNDVEVAMDIYTNEGCASCHRLKGFESNVGYRVEKEEASFKEVFKERQWFYRLFPEDLIGSRIVDMIDQKGQEIDKRIVQNVRESSILEKIEEKTPKILSSFYSPFKYAMRAKNHHYEQLIAKAESSTERSRILEEHEHYKDLVQRVFMMYIQEYGLGRDIAPRLHWSGVYRDNEWLIGHFRNPSAYTARSIMPVMPLDESKFYALTNMLRVLGKQNRDSLREIWDERGFDPAMAYEWHCMQCHGEHFHGKGTVSQWIYPIPKNLRDATFLRNLTRERAVNSITHGVQGTPMPPWGETAAAAELGDSSALLKESEIERIVDWLFQSLPGAHVIKSENDVEKWKYTPEDVLKELYEEKDVLQGETEDKVDDSMSEVLSSGFIPNFLLATKFFKSEEKKIGKAPEVDEVFDVKDAVEGVEEKEFFIKQKYYTEKNISEGGSLFLANCSHCHGKEAAGDGPRSATMEEAKPRMLTNLPWLKTRDDLRLLRSIKYGVPGTAMTPWGDKTNTLQRIQLVMFIRSLSVEKKHREDMVSVLFNAFETTGRAISDTRNIEGKKLNVLQGEYKRALRARQDNYEKSQEGTITLEEAARSYSKELVVMDHLKKRKEVDAILLNLKDEFDDEQKFYSEIGLRFIAKKADEKIITKLFEIIALNKGRYTRLNGDLLMEKDPYRERFMQNKAQEIVRDLDHQVDVNQRKVDRLRGKLPSLERSDELAKVGERLEAMKGMKAVLLSQMRLAAQSRSKQAEIYENYKEKIATFVSDRS